MTNVLLVTSWNTPNHCGIEEHSQYLQESVQAADPTIKVRCAAEALDPDWVRYVSRLEDFPILHLNFHRALHSRWTPDAVKKFQAWGYKVVITFHDTYGEHEPDDLSKALHDLADAFIVHEPCIGLEKAIYWRMGVPELDARVGEWSPYYLTRPILGTMGHDFGWKSWSRVCAIAKEAGWGMLICCPEMSIEREAELRAHNPWLEVRRGRERQQLLADLSACDATAFLFVCGNSGQSASILQGIGARKPVIAFSTCRQMRALYADEYGRHAIRWAETFEEVPLALRYMPLQRFDTPTVALAAQDSWTLQGQRYATLYQQLLEAR